MSTGKAIARTVSVVALGVAITLGVSCLRAPEPIRKLTYPPDFSYIPPERIHSTMWILAAEVHRLDELLRARSGSPDGAAAIEQIDHPGRATQHPALNQNLTRFAARIASAQRGADRTPPNYFQASALSGSCFLCHGSGDGGE